MSWTVFLAILLSPPGSPLGNGGMSEEHSIIAHGARSVLVTGLVLALALVSFATSAVTDLPWFLIPGSWAAFATIAFYRSRSTTSARIVPPGTHGDARFVLAVLATAGIAGVPATWPATVAAHPFLALGLAAALAGAADGAWLAMATRHLGLSPARAFVTFLQAIRSGEACTWRIVASGPGREGP